MLNKLLRNTSILFVIIIISGSSFLFSFNYILLFSFLILSISIVQGSPNSNNRFFKVSFITLAIWLTINFLAYLFTSTPFDINAIILLSNILILALAIVHLFGYTFWKVFERYVFYLTLISLPIFTLNILLPQYFDSLINVFRPLTNERFYRFDEFRNYWSAIIYVKAIRTDFLFRNCGFMWEPGAFAMMIVWGVSFHWLFNGAKFDRKAVIYTIALITTQSTAGYLAYSILITSVFMKRINVPNILLLSLFVYIFYEYVYNLLFVEGKIESYLYSSEHDIVFYDSRFGAYKVNRIQILAHDLQRIFRYPLGYGINFRGGVISVNGLSAALIIWGVGFFAYFLLMIRKFYTMFNNASIPGRSVTFFYLAILMMFFSNPIQQNLFFYLLIATPILLNGNKLKNAKEI
jgi:hypothetical protein